MRLLVWNLSEAERKFYFQKAKCRYIINSDRNTKLLRATVRRNAKRNHISTFMRIDGTVTAMIEKLWKSS